MLSTSEAPKAQRLCHAGSVLFPAFVAVFFLVGSIPEPCPNSVVFVAIRFLGGLAARETRNEYSSQGDCPVGQVWQPAVGREQLEARVQLERFVLERPCDVAVRACLQSFQD